MDKKELIVYELKKSNSSNTVMAYISYGGINQVLKYYVGKEMTDKLTTILLQNNRKIDTYPMIANMAGLRYESMVYKELYDKKISNYSPNFINTFSPIDFYNDEIISKLADYTEIPESTFRKFTKYIKSIRLEHCGNCVDLSTIDEDGDGIQHILFQIFYNLKLLNIMKIQHNDFHPNNILIKKVDEPVTFMYCVGNKESDIYHFKTRYIVKLFDWDLAYSPNIGNNGKIDLEEMCDYFSVCNNLNDFFDSTLIISYIMDKFSYSSVGEFLSNKSGVNRALMRRAKHEGRVDSDKLNRANLTPLSKLMDDEFFNSLKLINNKKDIKVYKSNVFCLPTINDKKIKEYLYDLAIFI